MKDQRHFDLEREGKLQEFLPNDVFLGEAR